MDAGDDSRVPKNLNAEAIDLHTMHRLEWHTVLSCCLYNNA